MLIADSESTACSTACILNTGKLKLRLQSQRLSEGGSGREQTTIHPNSTSAVDRGHQIQREVGEEREGINDS